MWNKIYSVILAAAILTMSVLTYFPYSWLQSKTDPRDVQINYLFYLNTGWTFLLISTLILLITANAVLWKTRRAWALWATFLYFAVFTIAYKFWLDQVFFSYQQTNRLTENAISFGAFFGVVLIILAAVIAFFNQYLIKRMLDKINPPLQSAEAVPKEIPANENN